MGRKAEEPLEKKDIILFKGDWERLRLILAHRKITPTVFIRTLVRRKLQEIDARAGLQARPVPELKDDDLDLEGLELVGTPAESDNSGEA